MSKSKHFSRNLIVVGSTFTDWIVLDDLGGGYWLCECICGVRKKVDGYTLVSGRSRRCRKCANMNKALQIRISGDHVAARQAWGKLKSNAKSRGLTCSISFNEFYEISKRPCFYCGELPITGYWENSSSRREWHEPFISSGLDRYDNLIGYELENIVPCCIRCNRAKNDMTIVEWLEKISMWSKWAKTIA